MTALSADQRAALAQLCRKASPEREADALRWCEDTFRAGFEKFPEPPRIGETLEEALARFDAAVSRAFRRMVEELSSPKKADRRRATAEIKKALERFHLAPSEPERLRATMAPAGNVVPIAAGR